MIAFFGTGLLGSNFVRAFRRRGEAVRVWNRTASKARALEADGAKAFEDPAEAARGATRIHLTLRDDAAVDDVLERARAGFSTGVSIVDHTTTAPTPTAERAQRFTEQGIEFLHAPVFMGPQNALEGTGIMLTSGDRGRVDGLRAELEKMTGKLLYLGPEPERAASFKLFGNLFLMFLTSGIAEVFTLAKAVGISATEAATLFEAFNPAAQVGARAKRMIEADFAHPSWELSMARKDARLMLEEANRHGASLTVLSAIAQTMDRFIERGHGGDDWTVIGKDGL